MSHFFPPVAKQPRAHIVFLKDIMIWSSLIGFQLLHTPCGGVYVSGVMWITYTGYIFPTAGLWPDVLRICCHTKGMGCCLGSFWVFLLCFGW